MNINILNNLDNSKYDGIIIPITNNNFKSKLCELPIEYLIKNEKIDQKPGSIFKFSLNNGDNLIEIIMLRVPEDSSYRQLLNYFADGVKLFIKGKISNILIDLQNLNQNTQLLNSVIESSILSDYTFDTYLTKKKSLINVTVNILTDLVVDSNKINEIKSVANSNLIARNLVNEPSNIMTPTYLSNKVIEYGAEFGFEVEILNLDEIERLKMEAFLAVAKGSEQEPKFIIMRYMGNPSSKDILGYIGKGLTYDSGGLSIKPTASMVDMKSDMAGAAAVIGAMCSIAQNKLKKNVIAVVAACENMISGKSYRPGDIISSMAGKSIFIGNTDAEGRLTLIDAMHYIITKEGVSSVVDIATLTGAAIHCTGDVASPVISNDDKFFSILDKSNLESGELVWRMPIFDEYKELIKHEEADLTNTAGSPGTITAGLFIGDFVNNLPWIHIDIAGPSMSEKEKGILSKGATGCGTRPLYYLAKEV